MKVYELYEWVSSQGVNLYLKDGKLAVSAPEGVFTDDLRAKVLEFKDDLIALLHSYKDDGGFNELSRCAEDDISETPQSLIQKSYWFLYKMGVNTYNIPLILRLTGELDVEVLETGLQRVRLRHDNLRTRFYDGDNGPSQIVDAAGDWRLSITDCEPHELEVNIKYEISQPFVLEEEPAFRVKLFRLSSSEYVLSVVSHHIMMDGLSLDIFMRELGEEYNVQICCEAREIDPLKLQYSDFSIWQNRRESTNEYKLQKEFWKEKLSGLPPLLALPTDYARPPVQSYRGERCPIHISHELTGRLNSFAENNNVTLFHVLLSGIAILLSRYSGEKSIPIGTAIANRTNSDLERLIGCFANTVVLRCDLDEDDTFNHFVSKVRDTSVEAFSNSDVPFDSVVDEVQPDRCLGVPPIFQVMFRLHNQARGEGIHLQGLSIEPESSVSKPTVELDLNVSLIETPSGIKGDFSFATDLFSECTIQRFIQHYINVLDQAASEPEKSIATINVITKDEIEVIDNWNQTHVDYPESGCIHYMFEEVVERFPDKVAYICGSDELTYSRLNELSNQVADWLIRSGVSEGVSVGVSVDRSVWMGVCMLAVFKSGGTYVPIDPTYPEARIRHMLQISNPSLVLTNTKTFERHSDTTFSNLCKNVETIDWNLYSENNPRPCKGSNHRAYILFTSGTTGNPKGISVTHKSLRNMPVAHERWGLLDETSNILQFASVSFSISIWGSFMAWAAGSTLVQVTDNESLPGDALYELLERAQIGTVTWPASLLQVLPIERMPDCLKTVISSAEQCSPSVADRWMESGRRFLNMYGNTEVAIGSSIYQHEGTKNKLSIGRALPNTKMYVLDDNFNLAPVGVLAEICTGGDGVAEGYIGDVEQTQKKFVPNPFSDNPSERLYRTGDLGRYLPNGEIEFVGRNDFQVSLRGYRVELTEIEGVLRKLEGISDAAVVLESDTNGVGYLVAFYVLENKAKTLLDSDIISYVKSKLPPYMIPALFVVLDSMPLTPNRKLDRNALSIPEESLGTLTGSVLPKNQIEKDLHSVWAEVLGRDNFGINDNFFRMGGHSLLVIKLNEKITTKFNVKIPMQAFFEFSTIGTFSKLIDKAILGEDISGVFGEQEVDLVNEVRLDVGISPSGYSNVTIAECCSAFLTGATGFVGAYLLARILEDSKVNVYCLVRATTVDDGIERIEKKLTEMSLWKSQYRSRIFAVVGDMKKPLFGLSKREFNDLSRKIDVIYHNGANVNFSYSYSMLKPVNVNGTQEIIRLACLSKTKPVHYISTRGVFTSSEYFGKTVSEEDVPKYCKNMPNGYVQSKWVAENIILTARSRGLPVSIYRLGLISGDSMSGFSNTEDLFCRWYKGCIQLRSTPDVDGQFSVTPGDFVAKSVVRISLDSACLGHNFHIENEATVSFKDSYEWVRKMGYEMEYVSTEEWKKRLSKCPENTLYSLIDHADKDTQPENEIDPTPSISPSPRKKPVVFYSRRTNAWLSAHTIKYPPLDAELMRTYFSYFISSGYLSLPESVEEIEYETV